MNDTHTATAKTIVSTSRPCRSAVGHVVLFLIIPGLNNVTAGCAMLIGRLLQETLEQALAGKSLLLAGPPSSRSVLATMHKETATCLNGIKANELELRAESMDGLGPSLRFVEDVTERLYGGPLLSFVKHEDQFYFSFAVSDFKAGQAAIKAEIKRLGFLELAQISHYDSGNRECITHHPRKSTAPLTLHCVEVLKGAGLLPR